MNPNVLKFFSYVGVTAVMAISGAYFYTTLQKGDPRWYFLIMVFAIALLLVYNIIGKRNRED